ncbi:hypothetical protein FHS16_005031 [Paenibacillus endophyticus]|uniref:Aminoglycoside phosphotransferase domain-containing protein n=1 Tax=Paenibacillus endophyticus TaxID=1294268 RepID=A0A7W5GDE0_9BACL|nr:phosphotransferase [Paenibacillus endophyticus]MBB3154932.1 hypothetical protein [Paenibacillus endophyticus]
MHAIIKADGSLDETLLIGREPIYRGMNGNTVERIFINETEDSLIFKPVTSRAQAQAEAWVNAHILSAFPPIYPRLVACSAANATKTHWILFEDLGPLSHHFEESAAMEVLTYMAQWQNHDISHLNGLSRQGPKPTAAAMKREIHHLIEDADAEQTWPSIPAPLPYRILSLLDGECFESEELVLSHGDLHLGNYARVSDQVKVLDWEHAHFNHRYWDLYHVIDLSHPVFPKQMTADMRERLLAHYLAAQNDIGVSLGASRFKHRYYLYASLLSLWMLQLIAKDLRADKGIWPLDQLRQQLHETTDNLMQCAEYLGIS